MQKKKLAAATLLASMLFSSTGMVKAADVSSWSDLKSALEGSTTNVTITGNITGADSVIKPANASTIDLNGKTLSGTATKANIYFDGKSLNLNNGGTVSGFTSDYGALTVVSGAVVTADVTSLTFDGNKSTSHGAGFYYKDQTGTAGAIFNATNAITFSNNEILSSATSGSGAGVFVSGGNVSFLGAENTFTNNQMNATIAESRRYKVGGGAVANQSYWNESTHSAIDATMVIGTADSTNTFSGNSSSTNGGAVMNRAVDTDGNATLTINGTTTFENNSAAASGGAIYNVAQNGHTASVTLSDDTTFSGNQANGTISSKAGVYDFTGQGGAIYNTGGQLTFNGTSTFENNSAANAGGAISNLGGTLTFNDLATFTSNSVTGGDGQGGAVRNTSGTINFNNGVNFTSNTSTSSGSAIYNALHHEYPGTINIKGDALFQENSGNYAIHNVANDIVDNSIAFSNGDATFKENVGGAIWNQDKMTFTNMGDILFEGNTQTANSASAITNVGTMTIGANTFTVTGNQYTGTDKLGAAIGNTSSSSVFNLTAKNVKFEDNVGGAVYKENDSFTITAQDSGNGKISFINNSGLYASAINNNGNTSKSTLTADEVLFDGNTSSSSYGGAIFNSGNYVKIFSDKITFANNEANGTTSTEANKIKFGGGAIQNRGNTATTQIILGNNASSVIAFNDNYSATHGGAIHARAEGASNVSTIEINGETTFSGNEALWNGGAVSNSPISGTATVTFNGDTTFTDNVAGGLGGAIYNTGNMTFNGNATFNNNTANGDANDIYNDGTLNFNATSGNTTTITLDGGINGSVTGEGNTPVGSIVINSGVSDTGVVQINGIVENQAITVSHGEFKTNPTVLEITNATIAVNSGAIINTIDNVVDDYSEVITLADGAIVKGDIDYVAGTADTYAAAGGATTITYTLGNALNVSSGSKYIKVTADGIDVDASAADFTTANGMTISSVTGSDPTEYQNKGYIKVTGIAGGINGAVETTDESGSDIHVVNYVVTANETFNAATDAERTIESANFTIDGANKTITAGTTSQGFVVKSTGEGNSTLTLNNMGDSSDPSNLVAGITGFQTAVTGEGTAFTIEANSTLNILNSVLKGNTGTLIVNKAGGTFYSDPSYYDQNEQVLDNSSIATFDAGDVVSNNSSTGGTNAVIRNRATGNLTVNNTTFVGNKATAGDGGAIYNEGTLTINGGSFTNNTATGNGGAIYSVADVTINATTAAGSVTFGGTGVNNMAGSTPNDIYMLGNTLTLNAVDDTNTITLNGGIDGSNYNVVVNSDTTNLGTVTVASAAGVDTLTVNAGTLDIASGKVSALQGSNAGTISGTGTLELGADSGAATSFSNTGLISTAVTNNAKSTLSSEGVNSLTTPTNGITGNINNKGTLNITNSTATAKYIDSNITGTGTLTTDGIITVNTGKSISQKAVSILGTGTLNVNASNLVATDGTANAGILNLTGGTLVNDLTGAGVTNINANTTFGNGSDELTITQGALNVGAGNALTNSVKSLIKATTTTIDGTVNNQGKFARGYDIVINNNGVLNNSDSVTGYDDSNVAIGANIEVNSGGALNNYSMINQHSTITNRAGGVVSNKAVTNNDGGAVIRAKIDNYGTFNNQGTISNHTPANTFKNFAGGIVNNQTGGVIKRELINYNTDGVLGAGVVNTAASGITGGVDNQGILNLTAGDLGSAINDSQASATGVTNIAGVVNTNGKTITQATVKVGFDGTADTDGTLNNANTVTAAVDVTKLGTLANTGTVNGNVTVAGDSTYKGTVTNSGTISGNLTNNGGTVTNYVGTTNGIITGNIVNNSGSITSDASKLATGAGSTIKNEGTITLIGGDLAKSIDNVSSGTGTVEITTGTVGINGKTITHNKIKLTSGIFDVTSLDTTTTGNIDLSTGNVGSEIVAGAGTLSVQDGKTGTVTFGNVDTTAGNLKVAIDADFTTGANGDADILSIKSGSTYTGSNKIVVSDILITDDSATNPKDPIETIFNAQIADDSAKANVDLTATTLTGLTTGAGSLLLKYDNATGYLTGYHSDLDNAITSTITTKLYNIDTITTDKVIDNSAGALTLGGTSLSITGNGAVITSSIDSSSDPTLRKDGIDVNGKTLTITNATIGSSTNGFATAIDNRDGGTVTLNSVTMTGNATDVDNSGASAGKVTLNGVTMTDAITNVINDGEGTTKGLFLTGTNSINKIADTGENHDAGQTTISSGTSTIGTLIQKAVKVSNGAALNIAADKLVTTDGTDNQGTLNLSAGDLASKITDSQAAASRTGVTNIAGVVNTNGNTITQKSIVVGKDSTGAAKDATLTNDSTITAATIAVTGGDTATGAKLANTTGTINTTGDVTVAAGGTIDNDSTMTVGGKVSNSGTIDNSSSITATGNIENAAGAAIDNTGTLTAAKITNAGETAPGAGDAGIITSVADGLITTGSVGVVNDGTLNLTGGTNSSTSKTTQSRITGAGVTNVDGFVTTGANIAQSELNIKSGATLTNANTTDTSGDTNGRSINVAKINVLSGGTLNNEGRIRSAGGPNNVINVASGGTLNNGLSGADGRIGADISNSGTVNNYSTITDSSLVTNAADNASLTNSGTIEGNVVNTAGKDNITINNTGTIEGNVDNGNKSGNVINNAGTIGTSATNTLTNNGGTVNNSITTAGVTTDGLIKSNIDNIAGTVNTKADKFIGGLDNDGTANISGSTTGTATALGSEIKKYSAATTSVTNIAGNVATNGHNITQNSIVVGNDGSAIADGTLNIDSTDTVTAATITTSKDATHTGTLANAGTVIATTSIDNNGAITNAADSVIQGSALGAATTINNSGSITNDAKGTGTAAGNIIAAITNDGAGASITNNGTITGSITNTAGLNNITIDNDGTITGNVDNGNGANNVLTNKANGTIGTTSGNTLTNSGGKVNNVLGGTIKSNIDNNSGIVNTTASGFTGGLDNDGTANIKGTTAPAAADVLGSAIASITAGSGTTNIEGNVATDDAVAGTSYGISQGTVNIGSNGTATPVTGTLTNDNTINATNVNVTTKGTLENNDTIAATNIANAGTTNFNAGSDVDATNITTNGAGAATNFTGGNVDANNITNNGGTNNFNGATVGATTVGSITNNGGDTNISSGSVTANAITNAATSAAGDDISITGGTVVASTIENAGAGKVDINQASGSVKANTSITNSGTGSTEISSAVMTPIVSATNGTVNVNDTTGSANASSSDLLQNVGGAGTAAAVNVGAGASVAVNTNSSNYSVDNAVTGSGTTIGTDGTLDLNGVDTSGYQTADDSTKTKFTIDSPITNAIVDVNKGQLNLSDESNLVGSTVYVNGPSTPGASDAATINTMDGNSNTYNNNYVFGDQSEVKFDVDAIAQNSDFFANPDETAGHEVLTDISLQNLDKIVWNNTDINLLGTSGLNNLTISNELQGRKFQAMTPIRIMEATIGANGVLNIHPSSGRNDWKSFNPAALPSPIAAQLGGYLTQLNSYDEAFRNMDMYMLMTKKQRQAIKLRNKYAAAGQTDFVTYDPNQSMYEKSAGWFRPYAQFEKVGLKYGPKVSNVAYGSFFGGESELKDLGHGWDGMWGAYVGYNGSHQAYSGVSIYQNGGTLGAVGMAYKDNFFTGLTINAGANAAEASTYYGHENFAMLMAGIASKTGYNWELADGKFIIQPSYLMSYSFVNAFDYTNAAGVRINTDPLNAIQIEPGLKLIGNFKNGWQPYAGVSFVWNIMDKTDFHANDIALPEMSVKPFVKYGVGIRKTWGERFTGFFQTYFTGGGRNGVGLQAGFRWTVGKNSSDAKSKATTAPKKSDKTTIKKQDKTVTVANPIIKEKKSKSAKLISNMDGETTVVKFQVNSKKVVKSISDKNETIVSK